MNRKVLKLRIHLIYQVDDDVVRVLAHELQVSHFDWQEAIDNTVLEHDTELMQAAVHLEASIKTHEGGFLKKQSISLVVEVEGSTTELSLEERVVDFLCDGSSFSIDMEKVWDLV